LKKSKGLVLEINSNKAIVLTNDGQFLEKKFIGKSPQIGSEIHLNLFQVNWRAWSKIGIAAVFALIFIPILVLQLFIYPQMTVAYVTVDINPSIELGINKYDKVTTVQGLNQEGVNLLNKIELKKLPVDEALEIVTEEAIKENYINIEKENTVIISYSNQKPVKDKSPSPNPNNTETKPKLAKGEILESKVMEVIERNQQTAVVELVHASGKVRSEANELGISTGKYTLILEAWEEGLELSPESIKVNNIISAIKEKGANPGQFINHVKEKNHSANELENLTLKYEARIIELKLKDNNATQKDGKGDNINKSENRVVEEKSQSYRISTEGKDAEVNNILDEEVLVENDDKKNDDDKFNNGKQKDNNSNPKNNITEEKNDTVLDKDQELKNNDREGSNLQEKREQNKGQNINDNFDPSNRTENKLNTNSSRGKEPESENAQNKKDINNSEKNKELINEETEDQDENDNKNIVLENEEMKEEDDKNKVQELENIPKDKESADSGKPSNLQLESKNANEYKGFNIKELPENIRLMIMELLKKRNK